MEDSDFESIMNGSFDPLVVSLTETAETFKKAVDSTGEVYGHALGIGLPDVLASEVALAYLELIMGGPASE